ncbi:MAG: flagellar assembly protein FliW [Planctomycetota bacterium]
MSVQICDKETMVKVTTKLRGEIEVDESAIVELVEPLVGFPDHHRFIVYQVQEGPISWLQSVDDADVCFAVLEPFAIGLDPDMAIGPDDLGEIAAADPDDVVVYTMLVLDDDPAQIRTNLRAPILVGRSSQRGKQVVFDDPALPIQFYLKDLQKGSN